MSSVTERRRNNVRVGIFVTVAMLLALAVIITLTDLKNMLFRDVGPYIVSFDVASGVSNLQPGAQVRVGGYPMGKVVAVRPDTSTTTFDTILVDIELSSDIELYTDATILLSASLLGAEAWLDCVNVGTPAAGQPGPGEAIVATPKVGMLNVLLGAANAKTAEQFITALNEHGLLAALMGPSGPETMENTAAFMKRLDELGLLNAALGASRSEDADQIIDDLASSMANSRSVTENANAVSAEFREDHWPLWSDSVDSILTKTDETMTDGRAAVEEIRAVVEGNSERVSTFMANAESVSDRMNTELADKASALLDQGRDAMDRAIVQLDRIREDYEGKSEVLGEALANANLGSQQLKLALIELRRSPWKVLYRPTPDELEHELLYEATRSFAVAAADVKAASMSVSRILDEFGDRLTDDPGLRERLTRTLIDPLERYERAQQQLFDILVQETD